MNLLLFPALILAFALVPVGVWRWRRARSAAGRVGLLALGGLAALPGLLYVAYYFHVMDHAAWFYELRAWPGSELLAAGAGLLAGVLAGAMARFKVVSRTFLLTVLIIGISVPHLKPLLFPVPASSFQERWSNGVCLQSTNSSCGPASAATLLRAAGRQVSEAEIARQCYTYLGGTENWYLARYLRRQGCTVRFLTRHDPQAPLPVPAIAGVRNGDLGHFIPLIAVTPATCVTGDPLVGRREWPLAQLSKQFDFTGFFMLVQFPPAEPKTVAAAATPPDIHWGEADASGLRLGVWVDPATLRLHAVIRNTGTEALWISDYWVNYWQPTSTGYTTRFYLRRLGQPAWTLVGWAPTNYACPSAKGIGAGVPSNLVHLQPQQCYVPDEAPSAHPGRHPPDEDPVLREYGQWGDPYGPPPLAPVTPRTFTRVPDAEHCSFAHFLVDIDFASVGDGPCELKVEQELPEAKIMGRGPDLWHGVLVSGILTLSARDLQRMRAHPFGW